jgi:hypothetical protein
MAASLEVSGWRAEELLARFGRLFVRAEGYLGRALNSGLPGGCQIAQGRPAREEG